MGRWGEEFVARYLESRGFHITASGYRTRYGEIDLIAENDSSLRFVEVKTRSEQSVLSGRESVDLRKQQRLRMTAQLYLAEHPTEKQPQFDVAELWAPQRIKTQAPELTYIENAF
nr:YraN family protein [Pseudoflavonifractor sp. 524-17]